MNKAGRSELTRAIELLNSASDIVERVSDSEKDKIDNAPENLSESEMYERMQDIADMLDSASSSISEAVENIEGAYAR